MPAINTASEKYAWAKVYEWSSLVHAENASGWRKSGNKMNKNDVVARILCAVYDTIACRHKNELGEPYRTTQEGREQLKVYQGKGKI